jgi:hypothetical protein
MSPLLQSVNPVGLQSVGPSMIGVGGLLAWLVYRYLGLRFLSQSWFNLDETRAVSLILIGAVSLALNATS